MIETAYEHHLAGRREEAEALCRSALERNANGAQALHVLALMAQAQRRAVPAVKLARMAIAAAPDVPDFHNTLGAALGDLRRWKKAAAAFAEAIRLLPDYAQAHHNLGLALLEMERLDEAVESFQQAVDLDPANGAALWKLGDALRKAGRYSDGAAAYERLLEQEPGNADVMAELARAVGRPFNIMVRVQN